RTPRGRRLLAGFTAAHFAHHVTNSLLNPLLPLIRDTFALSYAQSGFAVSAFSLSAGLSNAPLGVLADRVGPRPVIVAGLLLIGAVSAALALAGAYWQLLVLLVAMGVVSGTYHAPAASLIARAFPSRVRGAAMGVHITGGHLSFFAAPLVAASVVAATGTWRTPYLAFALAPIATGALLWYVAPRGHRPAHTDVLASFRAVGDVLRDVGPLVSLSVLFQFGFAALTAFLALYLVDARGIAAPVAAAMFGVPQLAGMIGAPLGGALSDRLGRPAVILIGLGALGPATYAITLVPNELILVPLLLVGVASAMRMTVTEVLVMDRAPAERRATVLGAYYLLSQEVGGLAAPAFGFLAVAIGIAGAFGSVALALVALSALAVLVGRRL
ncbi:MAG: MFS transporter, partial [Candidatus Limnocylindria bacterium]